MNIILDNIIFSLQESGGISVYWYHLLKRLISEQQHNISYIEGKNSDKNIFNKKIEYNNCTLIATNSVPVVGRYLNFELPQANETSIFHSSYYRVSKNPKHVNITTIHDFTYEHFNSGFRLFVHSNQKKKAILNSDGIICISENTKSDLLKFIPEAADKNIKVIHNGVGDIFSQAEKSGYDMMNIEFDAYTYVLYVGDRSSGYKNFERAVQACKLARRSLAIVGGGGLTEKESTLLTTELANFGFRHFNNLATDKLNVLYSFAYCLLYPSKYEGFGIPPLEAQKAGCPVVAFNASSVPGVVGEGAILVNDDNAEAFASALLSLENKGIREDLILKGTKNVAAFSWQKTYTETLAFYNEIMKLKNLSA